MKFKDKFGNDVDCTPEEYMILMGSVPREPVKVNVDTLADVFEDKLLKAVKMSKPVPVQKDYNYGVWSRAEKRLLRDSVGKSDAELLKLFPDRTPLGIFRFMRKLHLHRVKRPNVSWTSAELDLLRNNLSNVDRVVPLLIGCHSVESISVTASVLRNNNGVYPFTLKSDGVAKVEPKVIIVPARKSPQTYYDSVKKRFVVKHKPSSCKHWSGKDKRLLKDNSDKPIGVLLSLLPHRSKSSIITARRKCAHHRFRRSAGYVAHNPYSPDELNLLSLHRDDSFDSLAKSLPLHTRGSIIDKLHSLYGRSKSDPQSSKMRVVKRVSVPKIGSRVNSWTSDDLSVLREHLYDMPKAVALLSGRHSIGSINVTASRIRNSSNNVSLTKNSGKPYKHGSSHGNFSRMTFLNVRAKFYMTNYNWSRDKAFAQASEDWRNGRKGLGDVVPLDDLVFKVVKFDFALQKYLIVNVFSNEDDAKACLDECKIGDKTINGDAQYSIVKVKKGSKDDDVGGNQNE